MSSHSPSADAGTPCGERRAGLGAESGAGAGRQAGATGVSALVLGAAAASSAVAAAAGGGARGACGSQESVGAIPAPLRRHVATASALPACLPTPSLRSARCLPSQTSSAGDRHTSMLTLGAALANRLRAPSRAWPTAGGSWTRQQLRPARPRRKDKQVAGTSRKSKCRQAAQKRRKRAATPAREVTPLSSRPRTAISGHPPIHPGCGARSWG